LVEDETALLRMTALMLKQLGYQVTAHSESLEALKLFQEDPYGFDLVITDMGMPDMDGERLAREMLKLRADLPIIMVSGFSDRVDEEKARQLGLAAFAAKPLEKAHLARIVRQALNHKR
jgi:two-component system, cell cycle sensor histidine kinase and response regulator CckA